MLKKKTENNRIFQLKSSSQCAPPNVILWRWRKQCRETRLCFPQSRRKWGLNSNLLRATSGLFPLPNSASHVRISVNTSSQHESSKTYETDYVAPLINLRQWNRLSNIFYLLSLLATSCGFQLSKDFRRNSQLSSV